VYRGWHRMWAWYYAPETQHSLAIDYFGAATARFGILTSDATYSHLVFQKIDKDGQYMSKFDAEHKRVVAPLTTGKRPPQMRMREKERMRPILLEIFSCMHRKLSQNRSGLWVWRQPLRHLRVCMHRSFPHNRQHAVGRLPVVALSSAEPLVSRSMNSAQDFENNS
jgi:hypothetical protein